MKQLFDQKQVEALAEKVLGKMKESIKSDIADKMYDELSQYLYEHYTNVEYKIQNDLIRTITEEFVKDPRQYKFKPLRKKLFEENKEELVGLLTDEQILGSVEKIVWDYSHKEHGFKWKWEEMIAKFVLNNIDEYKDNERIQQMFAREIKRKDDIIRSLEQRLTEVEEALNH